MANGVYDIPEKKLFSQLFTKISNNEQKKEIIAEWACRNFEKALASARKGNYWNKQSLAIASYCNDLLTNLVDCGSTVLNITSLGKRTGAPKHR